MNVRWWLPMLSLFLCCTHAAEQRAEDKVSVLVQSAHASGVSKLAYSPDGRYLVSVGKDGVVKTFDVATGAVINEASLCDYWLHAVVFADPSTVFVSCGDGRVLRWGVTSQAPATVVFESEDSYVLTLMTSSAHPELLVSFDSLQRLRVHSLQQPVTKLWEGKFPYVRQLAPSGKDAVVVAYQPRDGQGAQFAIESRDLKTGAVLSRVRPDKLRDVTSLAIDAAGRAYVSQAGTNVAFDLATGAYVDLHPSLGVQFVNSFASGPDGAVVGIGRDGAVRWVPGSADVTLTKAESPIYVATGEASAFAPEGRRFAWISPAQTLMEMPLFPAGPRTETIAPPVGVSSLAISSDDRLLAIGRMDGSTQIWSLVEGRAIAFHHGTDRDPIYSVDFDAQGTVLISSSSGRVDAWNPVSDSLRTLAQAGDHPWNSWYYKRIPLECRRATKLFGCGPPTPMPPVMRGIDEVKIAGSFETTAAAHDGGKFVVIGGEENLQLVDVLSNASPRSLWPQLIESSRADGATPLLVSAVSLSTDDRYLAAAEKESGVVRVLSLLDGSKQLVQLGSEPTALAFVPGADSKLLATKRSGELLDIDLSPVGVAVAGTTGGEMMGALAVSDDGRYVSGGGSNGNVHIWNRGAAWSHSVLTGHGAEVLALAFMHRSPLLVSASRDGSVRIWNYADRTELVQLRSFPDGAWLATDKDGFFDGPEEAWRRVLLRVDATGADLKPNRLAQLLFEPGMLSEALRTHRQLRATLQARKDPRASLSPTALAARTPPSVAIDLVSPIQDGAVDVRVRVTDRGDGMHDLRLFRNGTRVALVQGQLSNTTGARVEYERTFRLRLANGENRLSAYAFENVGVQSEEAVAVARLERAVPSVAQVFALGVGVNQYDDKERLRQLAYAESDAQAFYAGVDTVFSKSADVAHPVHRELIPGEAATREQILKALTALSTCRSVAPGPSPPTWFGGACPGPDDVVIVLLAGHGVRRGERFMYLPRDANASNDNTLLKSSVSDLDFEKAFADIDARRLILIVDACQAGFIAADSGQRVGPFNTRGLAQLAYEKGMYILGAAQSYHAALEVARHQHGLLTYALIVEGLLEQAADFSPRDRDILDEEWLRFPLARVPELQRESVQSSIGRGQALSFSDEAAEGNSIEGIQVPSLYAPPARGSTPFKIEHLDQ